MMALSDKVTPPAFHTYHIVGDLHPGTLQNGRVSRYPGVGALYVDVVTTASGVVPYRSCVPGRSSSFYSGPVEGVVFCRLWVSGL